MIAEVWRYVPGYEGLYMVSNKGRVKSLNYHRSGKERMLKGRKLPNGYLQVDLYKGGKMTKYTVHRLVAMAFIPNPKNLPEINHKDEDKSNNCVENLEWCTHQYNLNYGTRISRTVEKTGKPVIQRSLDGEFIREWKSMSEIYRQLGFKQGAISMCCSGKRKQCYGFIWRYKE